MVVRMIVVPQRVIDVLLDEIARAPLPKCPRCGVGVDMNTCEPDNCKDPECPILYGEKK